MEHLDVLDAPWKQDDDQMIEEQRKARGCYICSAGRVVKPAHKPHCDLEEILSAGEYFCVNCAAAYRLGQKHGHRQTEGQLLEHDPQ